MAKLLLSFRILGEAQPAGSKNSFVPLHPVTKQPYRKDGRIIVNTVDSCKKSPAWKKRVGQEAKLAMVAAGFRAPWGRRPIRLVLRIWQERPQSHFGTGRNAGIVKDGSPEYPLSDPDLTKLIRAVEDGMQDVVYENDSVIVDQRCQKGYGSEAAVDIEIWGL